MGFLSSDVSLCCQQREPSVTPGLVTPPLQWASYLPTYFDILFVYLADDVISCYIANVHQLQESSVSDDICDGFRDESVLSGLDML